MTATTERGQTLYDFALGMAIFLLVLGYVFAFVPSLFEPFASNTDSTPVRADRTADTLVRDALAEPTPRTSGVDVRPGVLDVPCTRAFFDGSPPGDCRYSRQIDGQADVRAVTGLPARTSVNVTMRRNGSIQTHDGETLAVGPAPNPDARRVVRAVRVVSFDGRDYQFVVKLW